MPKVSVIVPIYNVEKYITKCLESLANQTLEDIQIILVNDGSTDNSGKIAKEYADKYSNIIYLEKENGGLSDARNYGLKYATGDYISFVDSDDYVNKELYSNLINYMNNDYDMVKFNIVKVNIEGKKISENYSPVFDNKTGEEAFEILYKTDVMTEV
ncbi:MAG: glycosyltransferase family 2 protein, partial [Clostridia bacterium]